MIPETRRQSLRRMKIIAGQVQALEKQLEDDRYCMDILDLSLSIQKALRASTCWSSRGTFAPTSSK